MKSNWERRRGERKRKRKRRRRRRRSRRRRRRRWYHQVERIEAGQGQNVVEPDYF